MPDMREFEAIEAQELAAVKRRQLTVDLIDEKAPAKPAIGFALSGGGIRSATFALGLFQALARLGLLRKIDYLSTVSGGGYFGSCFGRMFMRETDELQQALPVGPATTPPTPPVNLPRHRLVEGILQSSESAPVRWLRENGRYLAPNGSSDLLLGGAIALRNWISMHIVTAGFVFMIMLFSNLLRYGGLWCMEWCARQWPKSGVFDTEEYRWIISLFLEPPVGLFWWSPWMFGPLFLAVLLVIPLGWAFWLVENPEELRAKRERCIGLPNWVVVLLLVVAAIGGGYALESVGMQRWWCAPLCYFVALEALLTLLMFFRVQWPLSKKPVSAPRARSDLSHRLATWLGVLLIVTFIAFIDSFGQTLYAVSCAQTQTGFAVWISALAAGLSLITPFAQRFAIWFGGDRGNGLPGVSVRFVASIAAVAITWTALTMLSALSHGMAYGFDTSRAHDVGITLLTKWQTLAGQKPSQESPGATDKAPAAAIETAPVTDTEIQNGIEVPIQATVAKVAAKSPQNPADMFALLVGTLVVSVLVFCTGQMWPFLNRSSLQALYNSRLRRAYLGASNPERWIRGGNSVVKVLPGDGLGYNFYRPHEHGGPLHLINVTINETFDGKSRQQRPDCHGVGMAVGPFGVSVGVRHHASWHNSGLDLMPPVQDPNRFQVFEDTNHPRSRAAHDEAEAGETSAATPAQPRPQLNPNPVPVEPLDLSEWAGISGAAFSTGLGIRTSLTLSLIAGFFNVRLGHWWDSGIRPEYREPQTETVGLSWFAALLNRVFPVPMYLLDEFTARFHGTARRHWYLTDGGHFENMGGYELIRRRVPLIVISDAEEDPKYTFEGMARLCQKARNDFDAEIQFWDEIDLRDGLHETDNGTFGTRLDLQRAFDLHGVRVTAENTPGDGRLFSRCHAAIATVRYGVSNNTPPRKASELRDSDSVLIYIKSSMTGDEAADVTHYGDQHLEFPQQTTLDQFFDEAQWESYRKLGEHIGTTLFSPSATPILPATWSPRGLYVPDVLRRPAAPVV